MPSNRVQEWAIKQGVGSSKPGADSMRCEVYMSLLDHRIRNAWLHTLYLSPQNFNAVARPLYTNSSTSSSLVRYSLSKSLQTAALAAIVQTSTSPIIDVEALYRESDKAFSALSDFLGDQDWFLGEEGPGMLDAALFAYTYLLLDEAMGWREEEERLGKGLREGRWNNLVRHKDRVYAQCYGS